MMFSETEIRFPRPGLSFVYVTFVSRFMLTNLDILLTGYVLFPSLPLPYHPHTGHYTELEEAALFVSNS
jgi:hypothetical protein